MKFLPIMFGLVVLLVPHACAETAQEVNQKAIKAAESGDMKLALSLFEQAVSIAPTDSAIMNNLGVTYMRTNRMADAKRLFVQGLKADPRNHDCFDNLKVLLGFTKDDLAAIMAEQGLHEAAHVFEVQLLPVAVEAADASAPSEAAKHAAALGEPNIRHNIKRIPRIEAEQFYLPENRDYAEGRRPFILTGLMRHWKNITTAFSFEALADEFALSPVDFYAENMREAGTKPFIQPLCGTA
jgi:tetratricopeptide (TPR) repeat protein